MNKIVLLFLSMCLIYGAKCQFQGDTFANAKQKKSGIIVLTYITTPGFAKRNASGKVEGICVDIMYQFTEWLALKHGIRINLQMRHNNSDNFGLFLQNVKNGKGGVFGLGDITITPDRQQYLQFSKPYFSNIVLLVSHKDAPSISRPEELATTYKDFTAILVKNATNEKRLLEMKKNYYPAMKLGYTASSQKALDRLVQSKTSYTLMDVSFYLTSIQKGKPIKRNKLPNEPKEGFGITMPKSSDWGPVFNEFISEFSKSSEYRKILSSHLGQSVLKFLDTI